MKKLNQELGLTLILVSHDIEKIMNEVMHVACVDKTLVCHETPEEYIKNGLGGNPLSFTRHHHNT
jgi:ABC-type Mn2+/Zn2+ transport system ATPase subunit